MKLVRSDHFPLKAVSKVRLKTKTVGLFNKTGILDIDNFAKTTK